MEMREKVIHALGECIDYFDGKVTGVMFNEWLEESRKAIALLKAQEPKLVTNIHKEHNNVLNPNVPWVGKCPKCGKKIEGRNLARFCKFCGQAVKWG